jgi:hypothetical protein
MASISLTAADIRPLNRAIVRRYDAAGSGGVGDAVYIDSNGAAALADADADASSRVKGIVVAVEGGGTTFAAGDRLDVVTHGPVAGYSGMTPGAFVYASTTAGDIDSAAPAGSSGDYVHVVGYAESATVIYVDSWTYDVAAQ